MAKYGYARVSTDQQSTDIQVAALERADCTVIRTEKISGKSIDGRKELTTILDFMTKGDTVCVHKVDRLGRDTRDVLNLVHQIHERGCTLEVIEPPIDTSGPMGQVMLTVLGMVSQMELGFIKERQRAGIAAAKLKGIYKGRPHSVDRELIRNLKTDGLGVTAIGKQVGCSRDTVYRALRDL